MRKLCFLLVSILVISSSGNNIPVEDPDIKPGSQPLTMPGSDIKKELPLVATNVYPHFIRTSESLLQWIKDAGFTHIIPHYMPNEVIEECLTKANDKKLKVIIVWDNMLKIKPVSSGSRKGTLSSDQKLALDKFVEAYRDHPATAGFNIWDEPSGKNIDSVMNRLNNITRQVNNLLLNDQFCYINMLPNYGADFTTKKHIAYSDYVKKITSLPTPVISFDNYPIEAFYKIDPVTRDTISADTLLRKGFYENLEIISARSRNIKKPFWAYVLSTSHLQYPVPNIAHLRLQVYSNLAYGAQGIQYFTFFTPYTDKRFRDGPVFLDGKVVRKTENVYNLVKKMNKEIKGRSWVFLDSDVMWTMHTGSRVQGTTPFTPGKHPYLKSLQTTGEGALVSELRNGNNRFLVIVNRDFKKNMNVNITFPNSQSIKNISREGYIFPAITSSNASTATLSRTVEPGDALIYMYPDY